MKCPTIVGAVSLLLGLVAPAMADNTACAGAEFLIPDGSLHEGTFTAPLQDRWFRFVAKANRSYALVSENLSPTDANGVGMFPPIGPTCAGGVLTNTGTNMIEPATIDPSNSFGSPRRTMVVAADTEVFFRVDAAFGAGNFRVRVEETTIFSPSWSTNGTFDTYYSFQNTANATINGTLTLRDLAGVIVDTASAAVPANGTFSTNTVAMATTRNKVGVASFSHDGPPGSLLCEAVVASFAVSPPYVQTVKCQTARQQR